MANSNGNRETPIDVATDIDKGELYGRYQLEEDRRLSENRRRRECNDKLAMKLAHKSLDIPEEDEGEDMDIRVDNRRTGAGIGGLVAAGLLGAGALGAGIFGTALLDRMTGPPSPPENTAPAETDHSHGPGGPDRDTKYRLEFGE